MHKDNAKQIKTSGATLSVHTFSGSGYPIFLLHGGPGFNEDAFESLVPLLSPPYQMVSYDQRGCGQSSRKGSYSIRDHVTDLEALRQSLGAEKFHLFGHSWGGTLALWYAYSYPEHVASLALCSAVASSGKPLKESQKLAFMQVRRQLGPQKFFMLVGWNIVSFLPGLWNRAFSHILPSVLSCYFRDFQRVPPSFQALTAEMALNMEKKAMVETFKSMYHADETKLQQISLLGSIPILLAYGRYDPFIQEESSLKRTFPQAQEVWFEQSGHYPWLEESEAFRAAITSFYEQI